MSRATVLARGRRAAERGMIDSCTIRRKVGTTEGPGGVLEDTWDDVYSGKCRVQFRSETGTAADVGEAALILQRPELQLPISATGLLEGDVATMDSAANDPDLVGRQYTVRSVLTKSEATARRVSVTEVTS